jgi:hypothetical protein
MDFPRSGTGGVEQWSNHYFNIPFKLHVTLPEPDVTSSSYLVPRVTGNASKMEVKGSVRMQECYVVSFLLLFMDAAAFELIHLIET